jgi:hypothetical protein
VDGPPEPDIDAVIAEDAANEAVLMDVEPVPDGQGGWVDDHTGMHPTATAYATTEVGSSTYYATQYATPTEATYHVDWSDAQVRDYNEYVGESSLQFFSGLRKWSGFTHSRDYSSGSWLNTQPKGSPWVDGFVTRYSWTFSSRLTNNVYNGTCPSLIYFTDAKPSTTEWYWFEEVFNDFQARFGYANYDFALDGLPQIAWPGMVQVVRSIIGVNQRPIERDKYETWFKDTFGRLDYAAPYMYPTSEYGISRTGRPTRFRQAADPTPTRLARDVADDGTFVAQPTDATVVADADMDEADEGEDDQTAEVAALRAAAALRTSG